MSSNRLKLNADKTQFIWLGPVLQLDKVGDVGGVDISPLDHVRDLGVTLDLLLTMKQHADTVARSCFYQMRQLRSVRRSLTFNALHTLIHTLINSKLHYLQCGLVRRFGVCRAASASHTECCCAPHHWHSTQRAHHSCTS